MSKVQSPMSKVAGWLIVLAMLLCAERMHAQKPLSPPTFVTGSGVDMKFTNFYDDIPPKGMLPVRVEVKNLSNASRRWELRSMHTMPGDGRNFHYKTAVEVPAGETRTFDLLFPLLPDFGMTGRYSRLQISVSGFGVANGTTMDSSGGGRGSVTPFLGMGKELAVKYWGTLKDSLEKKRSRSLDGTALSMEFLPTDWRGLAGFQIILLTEAEWREIASGPRSVLREWVAQGGQLIIWHEGATPAPDLPVAGTLGCGEIDYWRNDGNVAAQCEKLLLKEDEPQVQEYRGYDWDWSMAREIGNAEPPSALIMIFVILFAVIIGPLNFLVLAPVGRRHRLFWTIPLISICASLLMGLYITAREGFGGYGTRLEMMLSLPGDHKVAIWQEQVSRTGVLTASSFKTAEPILPIPLNLRRNVNRYSRSGERGTSYGLDGSVWDGDWFRSRTTQAQIFTAVTSSRGRLEILPTGSDGAPQAVSSFEKALEEVWYFDDAGAVWTTKTLAPGEKRALTRAEKGPFESWWRMALSPAGSVLRDRAEDFYATDGRGKFFASCATSPQPINSLDAIRWKDKKGLIFGYPQK